MSADDRLSRFAHPVFPCVHAVIPTRERPFLFFRLSPIGKESICGGRGERALRPTRDPAVHEDMPLRLEIIAHGGNETGKEGRFRRREIKRTCVRDRLRKGAVGERKQGIHRSVEIMVRLYRRRLARKIFPCAVQQLGRQIFVIAPNEDKLVPLEKAHEKFLQLLRLSAAVEQIAADDELFAFFFFKKTAFRQAVFQFVIKAVRIGGDIIFHAIPPLSNSPRKGRRRDRAAARFPVLNRRTARRWKAPHL